jgi:hypothetical protein
MLFFPPIFRESYLIREKGEGGRRNHRFQELIINKFFTEFPRNLVYTSRKWCTIADLRSPWEAAAEFLKVTEEPY